MAFYTLMGIGKECITEIDVAAIIFSIALALGILALSSVGAYFWGKLLGDDDPFGIPRG